MLEDVDLEEPAGLGVDLVNWGLVVRLLPPLSLSAASVLIQALLSLWTYLNSVAGAGPTSVFTRAVLTTEVMGVAWAVMTLLPRVLGSVTRWSWPGLTDSSLAALVISSWPTSDFLLLLPRSSGALAGLTTSGLIRLAEAGLGLSLCWGQAAGRALAPCAGGG